MNQQTILFILESFFPTHRAGTEVYVLNLCHYFKKKGWKVHVLIPTIDGKKDYDYEHIPVHTILVPAQATTQELNGIIPPRGVEEFAEVLKSIQPNWVHFHTFGRAINTYHLKRTKDLGFKTAFTPHLGGVFCIKGNLRLFERSNCDGQVEENRCTACLIDSKGNNLSLSKVFGTGIGILTKQNALNKVLPSAWYQAHHRKQELERITQYADVVFAIAPWIQHAFKSNGIHNAILIPQGISPLFFEQEKKNHKPIEKPVHFVFLGRMHPIKGFHILKEAWEQITKHQAIYLHIITNRSSGENDYLTTHKIWASHQSNITWNEALTQQEVADYLNNMDVMLLPSISEVAPLVILEAATRKIPVIASDYIAMKESIEDGVNGWLFENGNAEDLLRVIETIIEKPECIKEVAEGIEKPFSMDTVASIVEKRFLLDL